MKGLGVGGRLARIGVVTLAALACGAVGWAAAIVLRPAEDVSVATSHTYVTVEQGVVEATIPVTAQARWMPIRQPPSRAAGVVTAIAVSPGDLVHEGSTLFDVDLHPVVVAKGATPAFREIGAGATGADVAQLQEMLQHLGFDPGPADGRAGDRTVAAIRKWQEACGAPVDGVVADGDIVFVTELPARVWVDPTIIVPGATLTGAENAVRLLSSSPEFALEVTGSQADRAPAGTAVLVARPDGGTWTAHTGVASADPESGVVTVPLIGSDGTPVCGAECADIPVRVEVTRFDAKIVTVARTEGLVVPAASIVTDANGKAAVIDDRDRVRVIRVIASANGVVVVEGVPEGTRVRLPPERGGEE